MWEEYNFTDFNDEFFQSGNTSHTGHSDMKFDVKEFLKNAKIHIKFKNTSDNPDPEYSHDGDSGFDLRSTEDLTLPPMGRKLIGTGLYFELPESYELQVRSRSGLAVKHGIGVLTGTVDNAYRGEVKVLLINLGTEEFIIHKGDRIAQAVVAPRLSTEFGLLVKVEEINETVRGSGGFGSTGKK